MKENSESDANFGAGEGIRTLDINLGKVAEYPLRVADIGWQFIIYRIN